MSERRRTLGRWAARALVAGSAGLATLVIALVLALGTARGRGLLLRTLLEQVNQRIPGQLEVRTLDRLHPFGVTLSGIVLREPSSASVLTLETVQAELVPRELLRGHVVITSLTIGPGSIDLENVASDVRGIRAALIDPAAPPSEPSTEPPPLIRIDSVVLRELSVRAPELPPPWNAITLEHLNATARVSVDGDPEVALSALSVEVSRSGQPLLVVPRATAHLARPGEPSDLSLDATLGGARLSTSARAVLAPPGVLESQPLAAEVHVAQLVAGDVAALLDDVGLRDAFEGPIALDAAASGTLANLALTATLGTNGGTMQLHAGLRERRWFTADASSMGLSLGRVRAGLPEPPLALRLESSADLAEPALIPVELRLSGARFGEVALPELTAQGRWNGRGATGLDLRATRGGSSIALQGDATTDGVLDLGVQVDVRAPELRELAIAGGLANPPGGSVRADLRLGHSAEGVWLARGGARADRVRLPDLSVDSARVDLNVTGPLLALGGTADVSVSGLAAGGVHVPRLELHLDASPGEYRARGKAEVEKLRTTLDLRATRGNEDWLVRGRAAGRYAETPFQLEVSPTRIDPSGYVQTRGLALSASGQALVVSGDFGRAGAELHVRAPRLELGPLAALAGLGATWTGSGDLDATLRGRPEAPGVDATLEIEGVSRRGTAPIDARLALGLDAEGGHATIDGRFTSDASGLLAGSVALATEFPGGPGWVDGLRGASHRLKLDLETLDSRLLDGWLDQPLDAAGQVSLEATLVGSLQAPALHASLQGKLAEARGLSSLGVKQHVDYEAGRLETRLDVDDTQGPWLDAEARLELSASDARDLTALPAVARGLADRSRWNLGLRVAERRIGAVWHETPPALAGITLAGELETSHEVGAEPNARASFRLAETEARTSPAGCTAAGVQLELTAALARRKLAAKLSAHHGGTELLRAETNADVELSPALRGGAANLGAFSGALSSRGLMLEQVPYLCQRLRGRLDARVQLDDLLGGSPKASATIDARGLSLGAEPTLDVALRANADRAHADASVQITAPTGRSTLSAKVPITWSKGKLSVASDAPLSAQATLSSLPIAPLLDPAGALSYATGLISGKVTVGGTVAEPDPSGELELRDAELTATALAQPLHGVKGRFTFTRRSLEIRDFEARDRDGVLVLSGNVARDGGESVRVQLDARAKSFPLRQRGQVVATTSGRAKVDATLSRARSTVSVKLMDADTWLEKVQARAGIDLAAHPDFVVAGSATASSSPDTRTPEAAAASESAATSPDAAGTPPESHVTIDASDHFWIKREDFAIQLSTRLDARIAGAQVNIKGRVDIYRGYLDLMGRVFDVDRGSHLDFIGSSTPDPVVAITATYEQRSSGKTIKVQIQGRGSKPELSFFIDDAEVSAGEALQELVGRHADGNEQSAKQDATSFVSGLTAGLLATSARRELGAAAPIIMIEPGDQTGDGRIRAGFELDSLVPSALRQLITGIYVEGIVEREGSGNQRTQGQSQESSTQAGVLLELYFPHQLFSTGQWGPGTTWSLDWGWQL